MIVIGPTCRAGLTAADVDFVFSTLGLSLHDKILPQHAPFDELLDDEKIFTALLEKPDCLKVSLNFYFYVLVRHVLRDAGIDNRVLADYVAAVLSEFADMHRVRCPLPNQGSLDYIVDLLAAMREADERTRFVLRVHIGNLSLFLAGVFPEHILRRAKYKAAPEIEYYENMGRASYQAACDHPLAQRYNIAPVYQTLSESFRPTRLALNQLADRLLLWGD